MINFNNTSQTIRAEDFDQDKIITFNTYGINLLSSNITPNENSILYFSDNYLNLQIRVNNTSNPVMTSENMMDIINNFNTRVDEKLRPLSSSITTLGLSSNIPDKGIVAWNQHSNGTLPNDYNICNGANGTVDLTNRFVVGAWNINTVSSNNYTNFNLLNGKYNIGDIGGNDQVTLWEGQLPRHSHLMPWGNLVGGSYGTTDTKNFYGEYDWDGNRPLPFSSSEGESSPHYNLPLYCRVTFLEYKG